MGRTSRTPRSHSFSEGLILHEALSSSGLPEYALVARVLSRVRLLSMRGVERHAGVMRTQTCLPIVHLLLKEKICANACG